MTRREASSSPSETSRPECETAFRRIPAVNDVVEFVETTERNRDVAAGESASRSRLVEAVRWVLDQHRAAIAKNGAELPAPTLDDFAARATARLRKEQRPRLATVINATGIIIHTGLGRAPLAAAAARAAYDAAAGYVPVELDMKTGARGDRNSIVSDLICRLTGAEAATVVNNNAAALVLVLAAIARDREVVVSRGELIEIGGSFRLPDIMETGRAILREVGTTNRTRPADYENAITDATAALLKVHPSNYRVTGFTEAATIDELVALGRVHDLPVIDDIGSGALTAAEQRDMPCPEPDATTSIAAGADVVLFSGDKLLGGPQAGIIAGRRRWIERVAKHPLMRAMRVDKIRLAALEATLRLHLDASTAAREIPVHSMLTAAPADIEERCGRLATRLDALGGIAVSTVEASSAYTGGGSLPTQAVPSFAVAVRPASITEDDLATRLRDGGVDPAIESVVARVKAGAVQFDLRTVFPEQDDALYEAIRSALGKSSGDAS